MYYAHSTEDPDRDRWQRLAEHLANVSREAAARAELFGAGRTAALAGLFHDLGKYAPAFQAYISGTGESPDHATAGAREIMALDLRGNDGFAAQLAAFCVAGHHAGLPDRFGGEASLDKRLRKTLPALDPLQHLDCTKGPHPLLRQKVAEGKLGMKTGEGFGRWTEEEAEAVRTRLSRFLATLVKRPPS